MLQVELIGNLGAAAEVVRANGSEFIRFRVADSRRWRDANGSEHSETTWVDCVISDANHRAFPYLTTGCQVYVAGSLSTRVYSSQRDRMMKAGLTIHVRNLQLLGGRGDGMPTKLYDDNGVQHDVSRWYYVSEPRSVTLHDAKANKFNVDANGFVSAAPENYVESITNNDEHHGDDAF